MKNQEVIVRVVGGYAGGATCNVYIDDVQYKISIDKLEQHIKNQIDKGQCIINDSPRLKYKRIELN